MAFNSHISTTITTIVLRNPNFVTSNAKPTQYHLPRFLLSLMRPIRLCLTEIVSHTDYNHESSDEELGINSPIFDTFSEDGGSTAIKSMCNFTAFET